MCLCMTVCPYLSYRGIPSFARSLHLNHPHYIPHTHTQFTTYFTFFIHTIVWREIVAIPGLVCPQQSVPHTHQLSSSWSVVLKAVKTSLRKFAFLFPPFFSLFKIYLCEFEQIFINYFDLVGFLLLLANRVQSSLSDSPSDRTHRPEALIIVLVLKFLTSYIEA